MNIDSILSTVLSRHGPLLRFIGKVAAVYGVWYLLCQLRTD